MTSPEQNPAHSSPLRGASPAGGSTTKATTQATSRDELLNFDFGERK